MELIRNFAAALTLSIALSDSAFACAACLAASPPGALRAFYISTILLSTMPFALIAGFVIVVRRYRLGNGRSVVTSESRENLPHSPG